MFRVQGNIGENMQSPRRHFPQRFFSDEPHEEKHGGKDNHTVRWAIEEVYERGDGALRRRLRGKRGTPPNAEKRSDEKRAERKKVGGDPEEKCKQKTPFIFAAECERSPKPVRDDIHTDTIGDRHLPRN